MRRAALLLLLFFTPIAAHSAERQTLGIYGEWAAFRDAQGPRCYAIARPFSTHGTPQFKSYASFGYWPRSRISGQFYARLSKPVGKGRELRLMIGDQRFILRGNGMHGWAADAKMDAAIIAAARTAENMRIHGTTESGSSINDIYTLRGTASALGAAALGCAAR